MLPPSVSAAIYMLRKLTVLLTGSLRISLDSNNILPASDLVKWVFPIAGITFYYGTRGLRFLEDTGVYALS